MLAPWRIATLAHRHDPRRWTEDPRFAEFLAESAISRPGPDDDALASAQGDARRALALIKPIGDLRIDYLPRTGLALLRLYIVLRLLRRSSLLADLLVGAHPDHRREPSPRGARRSRPRESQLRETISKLDPKALGEFPQFEAEFKAYLAEYGHRETVSPVLVTPPTQSEAPETVLGLISVLAAEPPRPPEDADRAMSELLKHRCYAGAVGDAPASDDGLMRPRGIAFREDSHFYFLMPLPILRRSLLEMGRRLSDVGLLAEPEDVFHLRLEELKAIEDPAKLAGLRSFDRLRA